MGFGDEIKDVENAVDGQTYVCFLSNKRPSSEELSPQHLTYLQTIFANTNALLSSSAQEQTSNSSDSKWDTAADSGKIHSHFHSINFIILSKSLRGLLVTKMGKLIVVTASRRRVRQQGGSPGCCGPRAQQRRQRRGQQAVNRSFRNEMNYF